MRIVYKIYKVDTINVDVEIHVEQYGYGHTEVYPTVLREIQEDGDYYNGEFGSETNAEKFLSENLLKEYGEKYVILKEYRYD